MARPTYSSLVAMCIPAEGLHPLGPLVTNTAGDAAATRLRRRPPPRLSPPSILAPEEGVGFQNSLSSTARAARRRRAPLAAAAPQSTLRLVGRCAPRRAPTSDRWRTARRVAPRTRGVVGERVELRAEAPLERELRLDVLAPASWIRVPLGRSPADAARRLPRDPLRRRLLAALCPARAAGQRRAPRHPRRRAAAAAVGRRGRRRVVARGAAARRCGSERRGGRRGRAGRRRRGGAAPRRRRSARRRRRRAAGGSLAELLPRERLRRGGAPCRARSSPRGSSPGRAPPRVGAWPRRGPARAAARGWSGAASARRASSVAPRRARVELALYLQVSLGEEVGRRLWSRTPPSGAAHAEWRTNSEAWRPKTPM